MYDKELMFVVGELERIEHALSLKRQNHLDSVYLGSVESTIWGIEIRWPLKDIKEAIEHFKPISSTPVEEMLLKFKMDFPPITYRNIAQRGLQRMPPDVNNKYEVTVVYYTRIPEDEFHADDDK